VEVGKEVCFET